MENKINGIKFNQDDKQHTSSKYDSNLSKLFSFLAIVILVAGLMGTNYFGFAAFDSFNPIIFFGGLIGSVFSFAVLKAFAEFIKVANKYLNS